MEADPAPSTRLVTDGSVGLGALALSKAKAVYCRGWGGQCKNGPVMTNRSGKGSCTGGNARRKGSVLCSSTSGLERASAPVSSSKLPRKTCGKPRATRSGQFSSSLGPLWLKTRPGLRHRAPRRRGARSGSCCWLDLRTRGSQNGLGLLKPTQGKDGLLESHDPGKPKTRPRPRDSRARGDGPTQRLAYSVAAGPPPCARGPTPAWCMSRGLGNARVTQGPLEINCTSPKRPGGQ